MKNAVKLDVDRQQTAFFYLKTLTVDVDRKNEIVLEISPENKHPKKKPSIYCIRNLVIW